VVSNAEVRSLNDFLYFNMNVPLSNRPLINLLAVRFVVSGPGTPPIDGWLAPPRRPRWTGYGVKIFENTDALPRAYYVPRVEVVESPRALLDRLASPEHRPREAALVESTPADGFLGDAAPPGGEVALQDEAEVVRLDVTAPHPGFVVLTDQHYPGWRAKVNDDPAPILRANYAFRAVRVPGGHSVVEFRYRPWSVWLGALVSLATLCGVVVGVVQTARRGADRSGAA
jgi:hypothetical protein